MLTHRTNLITAALTAVIFVASLLSGCATTRHVRELQADIQRLEAKQDSSQTMISRIDGSISSSSDENGRLRADVATTVQELGQKIDMLLENYNELLAKIDQISRQPERVYIKNSPGSQTDTPVAGGNSEAAVQTLSIDCVPVYDSAFILVLRGEYETAVTGFEEFLQNCPDHENNQSAHYWIGECLYSQEKYVECIQKLSFLIQQFPGTPYMSRALHKVGRSQQELGQNAEARKSYDRLVDEFPGTLEAEQAKDQLKVLK